MLFDFSNESAGNQNAPLTLAKRYLYGPAVDQLLAQENVEQAPESAARVTWMLTDNLGSVRDLVDNSGALVANGHYSYDAYGQVLSGDTMLTRYLYTGREFERFTNLQYNRERWYDAETGRWISNDPLSFSAGDSNLRRYVGNSPTNFRDPSGLGADGGEGDGEDPLSGLVPPILPWPASVSGPAEDPKPVKHSPEYLQSIAPGGNAAEFARYKASLAQQEIANARRVGSALKSDTTHRAPTFVIDQIGELGSVFGIVGADGIQRTLTQMPGSVDDQAGVFEWIIDKNGSLTHQRFIPGGPVSGTPNLPPSLFP